MSHANAALTPRARERLARLVVDRGWTCSAAAKIFMVCPRTAKKWADRYRAEGPAGMVDHSSRPHTSPTKTPPVVVKRIVRLRWRQRPGVLTHPRVFDPPTELDVALAQVEALRTAPGVTRVVPGPRHWETVARLCRAVDARGNLVADAQHAAVAVEHGATWVSLDRDFARFPGLRARSPLRPPRA